MVSAATFSGEASFEHDDFTYHLTMNAKAFVHAEGILDESMVKFLPQVLEQLQFKVPPQVRHMSALVFGGLKNNHKYIDYDFVLDLALAQHPGMMNALFQALDAVDIPEDNSGNPQAPTAKPRGKKITKAGTGTGSFKAGAKRGSRRKPSG